MTITRLDTLTAALIEIAADPDNAISARLEAARILMEAAPVKALEVPTDGPPIDMAAVIFWIGDATAKCSTLAIKQLEAFGDSTNIRRVEGQPMSGLEVGVIILLSLSPAQRAKAVERYREVGLGDNLSEATKQRKMTSLISGIDSITTNGLPLPDHVRLPDLVPPGAFD